MAISPQTVVVSTFCLVALTAASPNFTSLFAFTLINRIARRTSADGMHVGLGDTTLLFVNLTGRVRVRSRRTWLHEQGNLRSAPRAFSSGRMPHSHLDGRSEVFHRICVRE